jgi:enoyl-CoA hydratase/carnithine racemase
LTIKRQDTLGSELVSALEDAWTAIRRDHPELPPAVLITGAGSLGTRSGLRLGHFAASRWQAGADGALGEIFVGGEGLKRGARPVLATLLHEAAHVLAHKRGIKDTSRQGRYHNRRFKTLAEELGLHVDHDRSL